MNRAVGVEEGSIPRVLARPQASNCITHTSLTTMVDGKGCLDLIMVSIVDQTQRRWMQLVPRQTTRKRSAEMRVQIYECSLLIQAMRVRAKLTRYAGGRDALSNSCTTIVRTLVASLLRSLNHIRLPRLHGLVRLWCLRLPAFVAWDLRCWRCVWLLLYNFGIGQHPLQG